MLSSSFVSLCNIILAMVAFRVSGSLHSGVTTSLSGLTDLLGGCSWTVCFFSRAKWLYVSIFSSGEGNSLESSSDPGLRIDWLFEGAEGFERAALRNGRDGTLRDGLWNWLDWDTGRRRGLGLKPMKAWAGWARVEFTLGCVGEPVVLLSSNLDASPEPLRSPES